MANAYLIPPDTNEKEKAIGGVLTFFQAGWIAGGAVIGLIMGAIAYVITQSTPVTIIFAIPGILAGLPFAFYKKYEMPFFTYLRRKKKFNNKPHKLINTKNSNGLVNINSKKERR